MRHLLSGLLALLPLLSYAKEGPLATASSPKNLSFIENKGQITDQNRQQRPDIDFKLSSGGISVFIGDGQIHYQFSRIENPEVLSKLRQLKKSGSKIPASKDLRISMYRMDVSLVGANVNAQVVSEEEQQYLEHYYLPGLGENGATSHSFKKITYKDVYPNIDWVLYTKGGQLKYEFVIRPGGNPSDIKLKFGGASSLSLGRDGSFSAVTPMGTVREEAPYTYEAAGNKLVASAFELKNNVLSFSLASHEGTVVIDPTVAWSLLYGGADYEDGQGITTDASGNVFVTGSTVSLGYIATIGAYQTNNNGGTVDFIDAYLAKMNSSGTLSWATFYGGTGDDYGAAIACDASGDVYIAGTTASFGTMSSSGAYQTFNGGGFDGFVAKFSSATGNRSWGTFIGGAGDDPIFGLAVNASGVYAGGRTSTTSGMGASAYQTSFGGGTVDGYVTKLNTAGTARLWGTYYGGTGDDAGTDIAVDGSGNVYLTGWTNSSSGIASTGAYQTVFGGIYDALLVKFNASGARQWGTYFGSSGDDEPFAIASDASANIFIGGATNSSSGIPFSGGFQTSYGGAVDAFVIKFNSLGTGQWGTYYGGDDYDEIDGLSPDASGNVYISGYTASTFGFPLTNGFQTTYGGGGDDGIVGKITASGSLGWSSYYGSTGEEENGAVRVDATGNVYLASQTNSVFGTNGGFVDALFTKITDCTTPPQPSAITGNTTVCSSFVYTYSVPAVAGATSYTWILPSGWTGSSTTNSINATASLNSGTISVTANNACGASGAQTLIVSVTAGGGTATITPAGPTTFCTGGSVVLNANTGTGFTYQWQLNGGTISGATNASYTATTSGNYTVTISGGSNCGAASAPVTVTVNTATAAITPAGATTFCSGGSVVLNANTGTGFTYQWKLNGSNISGATNASYTAAASGNYTVVVSVGASCSATSTAVTVTVNAAPAATITPAGPTSFCTGGNVQLNANTGTGLTYQWQLNGSNIGAANSSSYTANASGSYTVVVTNTGNCSTTSSAVTVTVNSTPTATATPSGATTFCSGGSVTLNANTGTGLTYQWQLNGNPIATANGSSLVVTASGSYSVVVSAGSCSATSSSVTVTVNAAPTATITAAGPVSFCTGGNVQLNANTGTGLTYQWQLNGSNIGAANGASYTASTAGSYTVIVTNAGNCSTTSAAVVVTVGTAPAATATPAGPTTFCAGGNVLLNANTGAGLTYQWQLNGSPISGANGTGYTATSSGNYTVVVTSGVCSTVSTAVAVSVTPGPANLTAGSNSPVCVGGTISLTAGSSTAGVAYSWAGPVSYSSNQQNPSITNAALANAGAYTVTATANGCSSTATTTVAVASGSPAQPGTISGSLTVCAGSSQVYSIASVTGASSYTWSIPSGWTGSSTSNSITLTAGATGGVISVIAVNGCGSSAAQSVTITVIAAPAAAITPAGPTTFCAGGSVALDANTGGSLTYQWQLNSSNISGATNASYTASAAGSYTVIVSNGTCSSTSASVTVAVNPAPAANITAAGPVVFCQGDNVVLNANTGTGYSYQWQLNGSSISGATNASYTATASGNYTVVITSGGCNATSTATSVTVHPLPSATAVNNNFVLSTTASFATYQWYLNSTAIPGATNATYTVTQNGNYYVIVTDANGCSNQSNQVIVTNVGVQDIQSGNLSFGLYPNPNNGIFVVEGQIKSKELKVKIEITDMTGRVLFTEEVAVNDGKIRKEIRLEDYASGLYLLKLKTGNESGVVPFMKK